MTDHTVDETNHDGARDALIGPRAEGILSLDVLRGVALYGVLLANTVVWFSGLAFLPPADAAPVRTVDRVTEFVLDVLVHGKAMSLLSFLFGLGFAMQLQRAERSGRAVTPMYLRRLASMFLIGVAHVVLLWWGDVLRAYAIAGLLLLLFRRRSDRTLLVWAAALTLLPQMVTFYPGYSPFIARISPGPLDEHAFRADLVAALRGHYYVRLVRMQTLQSVRFLVRAVVPSFSWTLGRFLIGFVVGRREILADPARHLPLLRRALAWGLPLGIAGSLVEPMVALLRGDAANNEVVLLRIALEIPWEIGALALTAASVAAVVLLLRRPRAERVLAWLAPTGQMPLTTYLTQSLVASFLFDGWGLGLIGRVGTAACVPLTAFIFCGQVVIARAWMKRFRFGPAEWVWRALSYGVRPPMLRSRSRATRLRAGVD